MVEPADERYGKEHHDEDRLGEETDHAGPARTHRSIRIGGIDRGKTGEETAERENEAGAEHVAHEREEQRVACQDRDEEGDEHRRGKRHIGRRAKNPRTLLGYDLILVQKLPDVPVGLKDARSALRLQNLLEPAGDAFNERCECHHDEDLDDVVGDPLDHGSASRGGDQVAERSDSRDDTVAASMNETGKTPANDRHSQTTPRPRSCVPADLPIERASVGVISPRGRLRRTPSPSSAI